MFIVDWLFYYCLPGVQESGRQARAPAILRLRALREMGGAPGNPAPRNHFLVWIVKPSGCHCTDAFGGKQIS